MSDTTIRFTRQRVVSDGLLKQVEGEPILTLWVDEISLGVERERRGAHGGGGRGTVDEKFQFDLQQIKVTDDTAAVAPSGAGRRSGAGAGAGAGSRGGGRQQRRRQRRRRRH